MTTVATIIGVLSTLIGLFSFFLVLREAFRTSAVWGLACFVPFGIFVFIVTHWDDTAEAAGLFLVAMILAVVGGAIT